MLSSPWATGNLPCPQLSMFSTGHLATTIAPLEAITGKKPDLEHLRVFGCPAYVHIPSQRRTKMEAPSRKGVFVGYTPNSQSWQVYFPATRIVLSSRSVTFDEEWRPLSPYRVTPSAVPFSESTPVLEHEPFMFKHPVTSGALPPMVNHTPFGQLSSSESRTLPAQPLPPTLPTHGTQLTIPGVEVQLPALWCDTFWPPLPRHGHPICAIRRLTCHHGRQ